MKFSLLSRRELISAKAGQDLKMSSYTRMTQMQKPYILKRCPTNAQATKECIISIRSPELVLNISLRPTKRTLIPIHKYHFSQRMKRSQYTINFERFCKRIFLLFLPNTPVHFVVYSFCKLPRSIPYMDFPHAWHVLVGIQVQVHILLGRHDQIAADVIQC